MSKIIAGKKIIDNVSFELKENEILGIVGRNGSGKTTLFKILLSMWDFDEGDVVYYCEPNLNFKQDIGYLPEQRGLFNREKVINQLKLFAQLKGLNKQTASEKITFWLDFFELGELADYPINQLSKGNQQKVQFILSVLNEPRLLILDEPFSGLDPLNRLYFENAIKLLKKSGTTILFSSHDLKNVNNLSDRILMLKNGVIAEQGRVEDILKYYTKFVTINLEYQKLIPDLQIQLEEKNIRYSILATDMTINLSKDIDQQIFEQIFTTKNLKMNFFTPNFEDVFKFINLEERI
ncbi:ABC transporter ATP-binding protein [Streptococcus sp. H31]|uniref:ABC transporter ATP-binding protein n=1 Tax=Streptococcus huangxiaojuni TaxID=3237239 RepID=UPI0034A305E8